MMAYWAPIARYSYQQKIIADCRAQVAQERKAAAEKRAAAEAQAKAEDQDAAYTKQLQDAGFKVISFDDFILDGKDLESNGDQIAIHGYYLKQGMAMLYASLIDATMSLNDLGNPQKIPLLIDDAPRDIRAALLACDHNPYTACELMAAGQVISCTLTNGFGASRETMCIQVQRGWWRY